VAISVYLVVIVVVDIKNTFESILHLLCHEKRRFKYSRV
jgi:hypothetical protein